MYAYIDDSSSTDYSSWDFTPFDWALLRDWYNDFFNSNNVDSSPAKRAPVPQTEQSRYSNVGMCKAVTHVVSSAAGGATAGFVTGGLVGAASGAVIGGVGGVLDSAFEVDEPGVRGAVAGGISGTMEAINNAERITPDATTGAIRGAFGEVNGVVAQVGVAANGTRARTGGYSSLTRGARGALTVGSRATLIGWGGMLGLVVQQGFEGLGSSLCESVYGN